jgi:hypothetical protein
MEKLIRLSRLLMVGADCATNAPAAENKAATIPEATHAIMPPGVVYLAEAGFRNLAFARPTAEWTQGINHSPEGSRKIR